MGSGCIDPHFLDLGTTWRRVVKYMRQPLYPRGKSPATHWIGGWLDLKAGLDDVEKRIFDPAGTRTLTPRPSSPLVAIPAHSGSINVAKLSSLASSGFSGTQLVIACVKFMMRSGS
jgi:hypothetical protein